MEGRPLPEVEKLGGGVFSLPVPIPDNPLRYTLVYLLESDRGPVLVDAGWHHPDSWEKLADGVATTGHDLADVYGVLVTHHHPDHHGLAGRVRETSGAWIAMHPADADVVRRHRAAISGDDDERIRERMAEGLHQAGAPRDELEALAGPPSIEPPALPDRDLVDGELADVPGREVRAVWTPGHSPGHTCFHLELGWPGGDDAAGGTDALLAGDHLLPGITPHVGLYEPDPDHDPLGDFLTSLSKVGDVAPDEILPAHEHRFADAAGRVRDIADHHERRLQEILDDLDGDRRTVWEIAEDMAWSDPWPEIPQQMRMAALGEAAAHVRHLVGRGDLTVVEGTSPVRFARA